MRASLCCVADDLHEFGVEHPGEMTWSDTETKQRKTQDNRRRDTVYLTHIPSLELFPFQTTWDQR